MKLGQSFYRAQQKQELFCSASIIGLFVNEEKKVPTKNGRAVSNYEPGDND